MNPFLEPYSCFTTLSKIWGSVHAIYDLIQQEIVKALKTDDDLNRLNNEARLHSHKHQDESAMQQVRLEVARLLRLQGIDIGEGFGTSTSALGTDTDHPTRTHKPRLRTQPLDIHDPPTYIRIVWEENNEVTFYPEQRRYIRIETDANSNYHDPHDPLCATMCETMIIDHLV